MAAFFINATLLLKGFYVKSVNKRAIDYNVLPNPILSAKMHPYIFIPFKIIEIL